MKYSSIFQELGLAKNEALIYETLLTYGEISVGAIALHSRVHRRNVYDSLNRLTEKGLVFEIMQKNETHYKAVDPNKLMEFLKEKESMLETILPELNTLYSEKPHKQEVYIYRGSEGWKNYMRDILRVGKPVYFIGAKGAWLDERTKNFFPFFMKEAKKQSIEFKHLFDHEVKKECPGILDHIGSAYKFLPKGYSAPASVDIFGDHVTVISGIKIGQMEEDFALTVIVNPPIAEAFRTWFRFMWDFCPKLKGASREKAA